jgi:hypothetical protein
MIANLQLEIEARKEKLRAMCEAQCASLRSRLERRVNRIPAAKRQMMLVDFLAPSVPQPPKVATAKAAPTKATSTKAAPAKKALPPVPAPAAAPAPAPAARKTRTAPATSRTATSREASKAVLAPKDAPKPAPRAAARTAAPKAAPKTTATRGKKRGSDEMSSEDKENAAELDVPKKRARAAVQKAPAVSKPVPTTRTTRAASRQKPAPSQVLSPKNSNPRQKPAAKPATRPR